MRLNIFGILKNWITLAPGSLPRRVLSLVLGKSKGYIEKHTALKSHILRFVHKFPPLLRLLEKMLTMQSTAVTDTPLSLRLSSDALSRRAKVIYIDLKSVIHGNKLSGR